DDHDAPAPFERPIRRAIDDLADLIDPDRPAIARLDDRDVGMNATRDALTGGARTARIEHGTRNGGPGTRNREPGTRNGEPGTRNREPGTRNREPGTRNGGPGTR